MQIMILEGFQFSWLQKTAPNKLLSNPLIHNNENV